MTEHDMFLNLYVGLLLTNYALSDNCCGNPKNNIPLGSLTFELRRRNEITTSQTLRKVRNSI